MLYPSGREVVESYANLIKKNMTADWDVQVRWMYGTAYDKTYLINAIEHK
jgi:hypothetical protein